MKIICLFVTLHLLFACKQRIVQFPESVTGSVKCVEISQAVQTYNPHSLTENAKMFFYIEVNNPTDNIVSLERLIGDINNRNAFQRKSTFKLEMDNSFQYPEDWHNKILGMEYNLIVIEVSNKEKLIKPYSKVILKCRLLSFIKGIDLISSATYYEGFFKSSFSIKSVSFIHNNPTITFKKSKDFKVTYTSDGMVVSPKNRVKMRAKSDLSLDMPAPAHLSSTN